MPLEERRDLVLVLGRQHGTGGIDEAAARLHQARRGVEDLGLLGHQLGQVLGLQGPAAVGIAPPRAGAGTGRIDQHAVEGLGLALQPFAVVDIEGTALDIVGAGAAQALGRAVEARFVDVHGHDAALVVHARGHGQGLAAGAGAIIGDLHAGLRIDQGGHELRALVLDFDQTVLEGLARHDREASREAQPVRRVAHGFGVDALAGKCCLRLLHGGLQLVDAEIDRRRRLQRGDLAAPALAVGLDQMRRHPLLHVEADPVRLLRVRQRMAFHLAERAQLGLVERLRAIAAAVEHGGELREVVAFDQNEIRRDDGAGRAIRMARALQPPGELAVAAQQAPDALRHGAAIAAADEAPGAEIGVGHEVGRPFGTADDLVQ